MLRILYASSTETLLKDLVRSLGQPGDPASLRPVLLPSRPLVERVQRALALEYGVAMGCELLLPAAFLKRLERGLGLPEQHPSWSPDGLFWRILEMLPALAASHPRLERACGDPRSRAALAREIADRLDQYLHFRPDLIQAWDLGLPMNEYLGRKPELKAVFKEGLPESTRADEAWQLDLWTRLRLKLNGHAHPAQRLDELARRAVQGLSPDFNAGVDVLATGPLPFPVLKMLKALGQNAEVRLRVLLPANGYLADIQPRWRQWTQGLEADLEAEANPLLAQMGRQAVEFFQGLSQLSPEGQEFEPLEEDEEQGDSLLQRLRSDVRALRQPDPTLRPVAESPLGGAVPLRSLRVHRCHGARREVEVLRDELLRAFKELEGLRPEDVLILAPDLDLYGPLAESALASGPEPHLPLGLAERGVEQGDALLKALLALLALASGRASLAEALDFLELPAVQAALGAKRAQSLGQALDAAGLSFGLDVAQRRELQAGEEPAGTWRFSLDRLLAGHWLGHEPAAQDHAGKPLLSVAGALGDEDLASALDWCEVLLETLQTWRRPAPAADWAERLDQALEKILRAEVGRLDPERSQELIRALRAAGTEHACLAELDAASALDYAHAFSQDEERRVALVGGRIALGGLKPLRALPCRVLAVLGLSDAAFPRRSQARAWDLLAALPLPGDRDPRKDDRQLFLDSLLAAHERVILTAPVLSPRSDKQEPLSVCVEELLRAALDTLSTDPEERAAWRKTLELDEAQRADAPRAFDASDGRERSFNAPALGLAQGLAAPRSETPFVLPNSEPATTPTPRPQNPEGPESLEALLVFLKDPAREYLKALGLALMRPDSEDAEEEPVDRTTGLQAWELKERSLKAALDAALDPAPGFLLELFAADRLLPPARLGRLRGQAELDRAQLLAQAVLKHAQGRPREFPCEAFLNKGSERNGPSVSGLLPRATSKAPILLLSPWDLKPEGSLWGADERLLLKAWVTACLAGAADTGGTVLVAGFNPKTGTPAVLSLETPNQDTARTTLKALLDLQSQGRRDCLALAPRTSHALARAILEHDDPLRAALNCWQGSSFNPGESAKPAYALAWRGRDPFAENAWTQWEGLARLVWLPLLSWWDTARSLDLDQETAPPVRDRA